MKAVCYLLVKFAKMTLQNLTKFGPWEAGSIVKNSLCRINKEMSISYCIVTILKVKKKSPNQ